MGFGTLAGGGGIPGPARDHYGAWRSTDDAPDAHLPPVLTPAEAGSGYGGPVSPDKPCVGFVWEPWGSHSGYSLY